MDWTGLGVIIIGLAMLGLAFLLTKPLQKLTEVLSGMQTATDELPHQITGVMTGLTSTLDSANDTIKQLNEQIGKLAPIFRIAGNIGQSLQHLFGVLTTINEQMESKTDNVLMKRYHLEGIYSIMALGYGFYQKNKAK